MQVKKPLPAPARIHLCNGVERVHVVGVAGSGLRALVQLLHERGFKVTGSELLESPVLETFRLRGIDCRVGHSSGNVDQGTNLVLISAAVSDSNPEVKAALDRRIPVVKYSECLGELMGEKSGIAVAGTHGKTTTTAMVAFILSEAGLDPTFVIGGEHPGLGGSARWGLGPHFVAEACEFDRSFLNLRPRMSIVTNIEEDHLDYFESLKDIQGAFADFVSLLPEDGHLVINRDDPHSTYLSEFCRSAVATFSLRPGAADWWAEDIDAGEATTAFTMVHQDARARVNLRVPGTHNIQNSLAAAAVALRAGVSFERIAQALSAFTGVRRRFDVLARGRIVVVDDYAHHPTEILAVVRAARQRLPGRRLVAVFQPHQHSRLRRFQKEFADALARFDVSIVADVFSARDKEEDKSVQSDSLVRAVQAGDPGAKTVHAPRFEDVLLALRGRVADGDAVIFMGAGSITDLARTYALEVQGD